MHSLILIVSSSSVQNSIGRSPLRRGFVLIALALILTWFALSQTARAEDGAVGDGSSTAEGFNALASLTTGSSNTAIGFQALFSNTTGSNNTATGTDALISNNADNNTATGVLRS